MMDAGYNFEALYEQTYRMGHRSVIAYNKRNEDLTGISHLLVLGSVPIVTTAMMPSFKR